MSDIVERLRRWAIHNDDGGTTEEAADEIERLRALASDAISGCEQRCDDRGGCPYPFAEDCSCDELKKRLL